MSSSSAALNELAKVFDDNFHTEHAECGWGQFLDATRTHKQIGPYGTCSGVIVRTLAGRGYDDKTAKSLKQLELYW
ncbi:MAG: hypothetical protein ACTHK7_08510, partial [Aureliella sp.]